MYSNPFQRLSKAESLLLDWARLKKTLKRSIMLPPGRDLGESVLDMPDHFQLLSQSYRRYQLNYLMQMITFGENFRNLELLLGQHLRQHETAKATYLVLLVILRLVLPVIRPRAILY